MYSMNMRYTQVNKTRPFCVMYARQPNDLQDYTKVDKDEVQLEAMDSEQVEKNMSYLKETVIPAMAKRMKETLGKNHEKFNKRNKIIDKPFPLNSKVMIVNVDEKNEQQPGWLGPYIVKGYGENRSYILEDLTGSFLRRFVPAKQIRLLESGDRRDRSELNENTL